jgi:hypothetical protein
MPLGVNQFIWSITSGSCPVSRDTVAIRVYSNISSCATTTPVFTVDLTSNPLGTWDSPTIARNGLCCTYSGIENCIDFMVELEPTANGITLQLMTGAIPGGALLNEDNCNPAVALGSEVCFTGPIFFKPVKIIALS